MNLGYMGSYPNPVNRVLGLNFPLVAVDGGMVVHSVRL